MGTGGGDQGWLSRARRQVAPIRICAARSEAPDATWSTSASPIPLCDLSKYANHPLAELLSLFFLSLCLLLAHPAAVAIPSPPVCTEAGIRCSQAPRLGKKRKPFLPLLGCPGNTRHTGDRAETHPWPCCKQGLLRICRSSKMSQELTRGRRTGSSCFGQLDGYLSTVP